MEAAPDLVRCPSCGAGNPADAAWCGQCLRRFDSAPSDAPAGPATQVPFGHPSIAKRDGAVVWTCPSCDAENPLEATACARCGSNFAAFFAGPKPVLRPRASGSAAVAASAALPGAGHWIFRQPGPAIARAVIYVWTVAIAILLLARPPASGRGLVRGVGAVFALAAAAVWLVSMLETLRMREGALGSLIQPKILTWLSAGLSGVLIVGLFAAAMAGRG